MMTPDGGGGGGHDHGDGGKHEPGEMASHQMTLPAPLRTQLDAVVAAYDEVTAAIEEADVVKIRASFNGLGQSLAKVDRKQITGHAEMLWQEYSMLLHNDVVEGREVAALHNADRVYTLLSRHVQRLREQFGMLTHAEHEQAIVTLDVPPAFQTQLARLLQVYLPIGQSLAADDLAGARRGMAGLQPTLASINAAELQGATASAWEQEHANLTKIFAGLATAEDIKTTRSAFALLSDEMLVLVRAFGLADAGPVYELHCPMAFEGRGASWLQNNDQARNPYYGATMLRCADRVRELRGGG